MATRGQNYPATDLADAIEQVKKIFGKEHRSPMTRESAVKAMGYSSINGASARKLAALSAYRLLDGRDESITVSNDAVTIIADENADNQAERIAALKRCLQAPALFAEITSKYENASVDNIAAYLIKQGFKPSAAKAAAGTFKESNAFVKRATEAYNPSTKDDERDDAPPAVGDLVQWESAGVVQFPEPRRVRALTEDGGQVWVFVDGSTTGLRIEEVRVEQRGAHQLPGTVKPPVLPLDDIKEGEVEFSRGRLSSKASFRLLIDGDVGPGELGKLIKLLETQKDILSDQ